MQWCEQIQRHRWVQWTGKIPHSFGFIHILKFWAPTRFLGQTQRIQDSLESPSSRNWMWSWATLWNEHNGLIQIVSDQFFKSIKNQYIIILGSYSPYLEDILIVTSWASHHRRRQEEKELNCQVPVWDLELWSDPSAKGDFVRLKSEANMRWGCPMLDVF